MYWLFMLIIDYVYLSTYGKSVFIPMINNIQKVPMKVKYYAIVVCYALMIFGLEYFIFSKKKKPIDAFVLGIVIYGVFESVNLALFNKWKVIPAIVDTLWGGILFYLTTWFYYKYSIWKKN